MTLATGYNSGMYLWILPMTERFTNLLKQRRYRSMNEMNLAGAEAAKNTKNVIWR